MDFNELKKLLYLIICMVMLALAFVFILGEMDMQHGFARFFVVKLFGIALGLGSYKGMKQIGVLNWLSK